MIIKRRLKPYLLLALALFVAGVMIAEEAFAAAWFNDDWTYRKMITVVGPVINGPHADFPMLVNIASDSDLAAKAQPNGGDIIFTNASGIKLDHETVRYNNSTGELIAWLEVDSINDGTVIYMYYGNSSGGLTFGITESEADAVWTNNYVGVWHLDETSPRQHIDSTSNDYDSTSVVVASQGQTATAKIGGADEFTATVGQAVSVPDPGASSVLDLAGNGNVTYSVWIYPRAPGLNQAGIFSKGSAGVSNGYRFALDRPNCGGVSHTLAVTRAGNWSGICNPTPQATPNAWNYVVYTFDNSTSPDSHYLYKNGPQIFTVSVNANSLDTALPLKIGDWGTTVFDGFIDEVRISSTNRPAGWIQTEFNNQNNPTSSPYFLIISEQVSIPTMTEWGMIVFMVLAGLGAICYLRRRRATP